MHGPSVQQARLGVRVKCNVVSIQTHQKPRLRRLLWMNMCMWDRCRHVCWHWHCPDVSRLYSYGIQGKHHSLWSTADWPWVCFCTLFDLPVSVCLSVCMPNSVYAWLMPKDAGAHWPAQPYQSRPSASSLFCPLS